MRYVRHADFRKLLHHYAISTRIAIQYVNNEIRKIIPHCSNKKKAQNLSNGVDVNKEFVLAGTWIKPFFRLKPLTAHVIARRKTSTNFPIHLLCTEIHGSKRRMILVGRWMQWKIIIKRAFALDASMQQNINVKEEGNTICWRGWYGAILQYLRLRSHNVEGESMSTLKWMRSM